MINVNHLCMGCMKDHGDAEVCPFCGYRDDELQQSPYLSVRTWLMDRYLVGKIMENDGEGVTYLGWDNITQAPVLIREFLPEGLCGRVPESGAVRPMPEAAEDYSRCLTAFLQRHRLLARLRDLSALFPTYDIFELNGTAYGISEYTESITLKDFLERNGNSLTFEQTRALMMPAASTLSSLHAADLIHGGISPETLFVGKDGKLRFGGFAGGELYSARGALKSRFYPGYTPMEQYGLDGMVGPHTDVYAFAATMYRVISGVTPTDAKARMNQGAGLSSMTLQGKMPEHAATALMQALQLLPEERTASVDRFRSEFSAAPSVAETRFAPVIEPDEEDDEMPVKKNKKSLWVVLIAMGATLLAFGLIVGVLFLTGVIGGSDPTSAPSLFVIPSEPTPSVTSGETLSRKTPDFVGQSLEACQRNYSSYEFKVEYKVYNDQFIKNTIISQTPSAGTELPLDAEQVQTVTVVVSLGSGQLQIPPIEGMTYAQAIEQLWRAGFSYDSITCNTTDYSYDSVVTKVNPPAGSTCNIYSADIMLYVEKSPDSVDDEFTSSQEPNKEVSSIPAQ